MGNSKQRTDRVRFLRTVYTHRPFTRSPQFLAPPRFLPPPLLGLLQVALPAANAQTTNHQRSGWRARLNDELPLLGHRNWIAVVDSPYPLQTSAGIAPIDTHDS